MATKIVTKNSSTASAVPTASDLVQGELAVNVADKRLFTEDNGGAIVELGTNPSGNVTFQDNGKAIFGAGSDLQIYHDGSDNRLDSVSSSLVVKAPQFVVQDAGGTKNMIWVPQGGSGYEVQLSHDGATKLTTTSTGIDVTGTATMDGLTVDSTTGFSWLPVSTAGAKVGTIGTGTGLIINTPSVNASFGSGLAIDGSYASDLSSVNVKAFGPKFSSYGSELNLFTSDDTSLLKRQTIASNGDISFYEDTGTTPKLFWDASTESLNLGTTSLTTLGTFVVQQSADSKGIALIDSAAANTFFIENQGDEVKFRLNATSPFTFTHNTTERMRIDSSGNLLVGKTSVGSSFIGSELNPTGYVVTSCASDFCGYFNRTTTDGGILQFRKDNATVGSIGTVAGRLGIGTGDAGLFFDDDNNKISPVTMVSGTPVDSNGLLDLGYSGARFKDLYLSGNISSASTGSLHSQIESSGGDAKLSLVCSDSHDAWINFSGATNEMSLGYDRASSSLIFSNGDTLGANEKMRLTSAGSLLLGTTSVISLGKQCIEFDGYSANGLILKTTSTAMNSAYLGFINSSGAAIGSITQLSTSTVAYNTSSDQRLKENIADADDAGSKIDAIQVRKYDWKADGSHQDYGMIAQELQAVAPEAVSGDADSEEMMGVDYSKLVPMLVKEIQSLRNRVAQLEE